MSARRGFTLIELVVSLGIVGVLSMALGSTILLSTRAMPTPGGGPETSASAGRALQLIGTDLRLATSVAIPNVRTLTLTVPDFTGDSNAETISYEWAGTPGNPLTRRVNADTSSLLASVGDLKFASLKRASIVADERSTTPADRVSVVLVTNTTEPVTISGEFRLLNARAP